MKNLTKFVWAFLPLTLCLIEIDAADSVTVYKYDARGRLIKVTDNASREVNYEYDDAGNRISVTDETAPPPVVIPPAAPTITSFIAPSPVNSGTLFNVYWVSSDTTHCEISIFGITQYTNLPSTGSHAYILNQTSGMSLKCFNGTAFDTSGKIIQVNTPGGGHNRN